MTDADAASPRSPATRGTWQPPPAVRTRSERTRPEEAGTPIKRISIEIARRCNLRCIYCYSRATADERAGLTDEEVRSVVDEAVAAGARLVSIVAGGEPLLRPSMLADGESPIDHANALGSYCCLYTNGTVVDDRAARWLRDRDVVVVGKLNSLREPVQDALAGVAGSARHIRRGIDALLAAGFADDEEPRLALQSVICRQNYDEIPELWRWLRRQRIVPELEIPTLHGRAADHRRTIYFADEEAPAKYRALFEELLRIDRAEFGYDWLPHPPFPAGSCRLYYTNCYVNDAGGVQPCAGVDQELGVLRVGPRKAQGQPLVEILRHPTFARMRVVHEHLEGKCRGCALAAECYGCRAAAWHHSGNLFAEDPVCWRPRDARG